MRTVFSQLNYKSPHKLKFSHQLLTSLTVETCERFPFLYNQHSLLAQHWVFLKQLKYVNIYLAFDRKTALPQTILLDLANYNL